jgi:pimeloyl-ACP methyl ester carboxylesterase
VVILNAGIIHRIGPSRLYVQLARTIASAGYRVLRFDLSGIGDSPRASEDGALGDIVGRDIRDAIDSVTRDRPEAGVVLMGVCSGADNSFTAGSEDPRVRGMVLVDPTIQRTMGFHVRRTLTRLTSLKSWGNVLSGRSLRLRVAELASPPATPPEYYDLIASEPREPTEGARDMSARGVQFLYVLTGHALQYCNSPDQVREAMPGSFGDNLSIEWKMDADHMLTRAVHREWLGERVVAWLPRVTSTPAGAPPLLDKGAA